MRCDAKQDGMGTVDETVANLLLDLCLLGGENNPHHDNLRACGMLSRVQSRGSGSRPWGRG